MRLRKLEIRNYKSLRNIMIAPTPLSVFVGPNGAGKTNLADAIDFLGHTYRWDLESAVAQKGGYENICYRDVRRSKDPISFRVISDFNVHQMEVILLSSQIRLHAGLHLLDHFFEFKAKSRDIQSPFSIDAEEVVIWDLRTAKAIRPPLRDQNPAALYSSGEVEHSEWMLQIPSYLKHELRNFGVFQLNPRSCRGSGVPTPSADLDRFGGNLPAVVAFLKKQYPEEFGRVLETVRRITPTIEDIETGFTHTKTLALFVKEKGISRPWTSEDISDGTIQTIALLTAVFDPRTSLVVIEEPENSVHPWALRNLVEAFRIASEKKQILLTTHSPILIDQLEPEEIWVVQKPGTETKIDPLLSLDPSLKEAWGQGKFTLSEYLDSGAVPEAVPAAGL